MDDFLTAKPLATPQIEQSFALMRTILPDLSLDRWRTYVRSILDDAQTVNGPNGGTVPISGIITAQTPDAYIHGLFCYRVDDHLHYGRVLCADHFIVLDLVDPSAATSVLLRALEQVAHSLSCNAICTTLPEAQDQETHYGSSMLRSFHRNGHTVQTLRLSKLLDSANDNRSGRPLTRVGASDGL